VFICIYIHVPNPSYPVERTRKVCSNVSNSALFKGASANQKLRKGKSQLAKGSTCVYQSGEQVNLFREWKVCVVCVLQWEKAH